MLIHDKATPLARSRTAEGFLRLRARIGRAGLHDYRAGEIGGPPGAAPDAPVRVWRPPDEVFAAPSLASFAGKPVTLGHPPAMVDSTNWTRYAVGHAGSTVERDGDHVATDLVVTDAAAVDRAEAGAELSNGYWADFDFTPGITPAGEPYDALQRNIRGNHVALVEQGRCGPSCTVGPTGTVGTDAARGAADAAGTADGVGTAPAVRDCGPIEPTVARLRAALEARDGEIAALRARAALDGSALDARVAERAAVIDVARRLVGSGFDPAGRGTAELKRAAVRHLLGEGAVRDRSDDYVAAAFDTMAACDARGAGRAAPDALARLFAGAGPVPTRDAARLARDAFLNGAWRPDLGDR